LRKKKEKEENEKKVILEVNEMELEVER